MRKKHRFCPILLLAVLILGLSGMGVTYAKWIDRLSFDGRLTTGAMDFIFHGEQTCSLSIVDENGREIETSGSVETSFHSDGKTAEIVLQLPFTGAYLTENDDYFIRLECPISLGDQGTVNAVELSPLDLTGQSHEKAVLTPASVTLKTENGEYDLPENVQSEYGHPLLFDVYRGVEEIDGHPSGIICLSLRDSSREMLLELPEELELSEEDLDGEIEPADNSDEDGFQQFDAAVIVTYHCSLPVYVEQGRQEILHIPEGVEDNE